MKWLCANYLCAEVICYRFLFVYDGNNLKDLLVLYSKRKCTREVHHIKAAARSFFPPVLTPLTVLSAHATCPYRIELKHMPTMTTSRAQPFIRNTARISNVIAIARGDSHFKDLGTLQLEIPVKRFKVF
jgi:hypothetical protein